MVSLVRNGNSKQPPQTRAQYAEPFEKYRMENDIEIPLGSGSFLSMQLREGIINAPMWFWSFSPSSHPRLPPKQTRKGNLEDTFLQFLVHPAPLTYLRFQCAVSTGGKVNSLFCIMFQSFRFLVFLTSGEPPVCTPFLGSFLFF